MKSNTFRNTSYEVTFKTTNLHGDDVDINGVIIMQYGEYDVDYQITKNSFRYRYGRQSIKFRKLLKSEYAYVMITDLIPITLTKFIEDNDIRVQENNQLNLIVLCDYVNGLLTDNK